MAETLNLNSVQVQAETPTTKTFLFELADSQFDYEPGQYITLKLLDDIDDPRGPQRPFTLSSSPTESGIISITIKTTESLFKQRLEQIAEQQLEPAACLKLRGPLGSFTLDSQRPAVLIAGGIGITPFRSMLRYLSDRHISLPVTLVYSNTTPDEIAFGNELEEIADGGDWLEIVYTITQNENAYPEWTGQRGRIDAGLLREACKRLQRPIYYVCGPPGMVAGITDILQQELNVAESDLRVEKFAGY